MSVFGVVLSPFHVGLLTGWLSTIDPLDPESPAFCNIFLPNCSAAEEITFFVLLSLISSKPFFLAKGVICPTNPLPGFNNLFFLGGSFPPATCTSRNSASFAASVEPSVKSI